ATLDDRRRNARGTQNGRRWPASLNRAMPPTVHALVNTNRGWITGQPTARDRLVGARLFRVAAVRTLPPSASPPIRRAASRRSSALEAPPRALPGRRHPCTG